MEREKQRVEREALLAAEEEERAKKKERSGGDDADNPQRSKFVRRPSNVKKMHLARILVRAKLQIFATPSFFGDRPTYENRNLAYLLTWEL